ncbi:MAG: acetate/propionate family kinase, partial [Gemmataceae bacterium]|nr:acetate/propionate family kinase [Gemmataceae bacterium]
PLAPLHHPPSLEALDASAAAWPDIPQVIVFDTAFHATLSEEARTYAIPARWREEFGVRRYGFHGLSYAYCARRAHQMLGATDARKLIVCHLGQGCSAAAIVGERCVETTMGFTPLEGLVMATRSGSLDPGVLLHLQRQHGLQPAEIEHALNFQSGLLGLSGVSGDMRQVRAAADGGHEAARLALRVYTRRIRLTIGALAAAMGGCDALVFTGGVGENDPRTRAEVCEGLSFLGVDLDDVRNASCTPDTDVARSSSSARVLVIAAREDLTMLSEVRRLLGRSSDSAMP